MLFHWKIFILTVDSGIHRRIIQKKDIELQRRKEEKHVEVGEKCS